MSDVCEHGFDPCPVCQVDELRRERDLVTETLGRVEAERMEASGQRDRAERERDAARAVVTKLNDLNEGLLTSIDQVTQERDEARRLCDEAVFSLNRVICRLEKQRDEAREAARECVLTYRSVEDPDEFETWLQGTAGDRWPWIKETTDDEREK